MVAPGRFDEWHATNFGIATAIPSESSGTRNAIVLRVSAYSAKPSDPKLWWANRNAAIPQIVVTHDDPMYLAQTLTVTFSYLRLPGGKIMKWDCKPEEATFERFTKPQK